MVRPKHFLRYLRTSLGQRRSETHLPQIGVIVLLIDPISWGEA